MLLVIHTVAIFLFQSVRGTDWYECTSANIMNMYKMNNKRKRLKYDGKGPK